jgi:hypothetical protein
MLLCGCAHEPPEPRTVFVPKEVIKTEVVKAEVPPYLRAPIHQSAAPAWVAPSSPAAHSCLDAENDVLLKLWLYDLEYRVELWERWSQ